MTMLASGVSLPGMRSGEYGVTDGVQYVDTPEAHTYSMAIISVTVQLWI